MQLTPEEIEAERERFEAWWASEWGNGKTPEREGKGYWSGPAHVSWHGWLSAIASVRDRRKQEQDAADKVTENLGRFWPSEERAE